MATPCEPGHNYVDNGYRSGREARGQLCSDCDTLLINDICIYIYTHTLEWSTRSLENFFPRFFFLLGQFKVSVSATF